LGSVDRTMRPRSSLSARRALESPEGAPSSGRTSVASSWKLGCLDLPSHFADGLELCAARGTGCCEDRLPTTSRSNRVRSPGPHLQLWEPLAQPDIKRPGSKNRPSGELGKRAAGSGCLTRSRAQRRAARAGGQGAKSPDKDASDKTLPRVEAYRRRAQAARAFGRNMPPINGLSTCSVQEAENTGLTLDESSVLNNRHALLAEHLAESRRAVGTASRAQAARWRQARESEIQIYRMQRRAWDISMEQNKAGSPEGFYLPEEQDIDPDPANEQFSAQIQTWQLLDARIRTPRTRLTMSDVDSDDSSP